MSIRSSLKNLLASLGGTSTANTVPGILGEISETLGGSSTGKTIAAQIDNIAAKKWADNPLSALAMDVSIGASVDLLGKVVGDLQKDIAIGTDGKVTGTLKYVTGYTGFSGDTDEQKGNYFAFHISVDDMTIGSNGLVVKVNGVSMDPDGLHVQLVRNKNKKITVTASKEGYATYTKVFDVSGLVLEAPPAAS